MTPKQYERLTELFAPEERAACLGRFQSGRQVYQYFFGLWRKADADL